MNISGYILLWLPYPYMMVISYYGYIMRAKKAIVSSVARGGAKGHLHHHHHHPTQAYNALNWI